MKTRFLLSLLAALSAVPAWSQSVPTTGTAPPAQAALPTETALKVTRSWEHDGSDVPADPAWRTGTLANGLRYAVRRNARPAGTLAIRVRIDAGALMEADSEQGWAHLLEHMVFRGTEHYADGEGIRVWQRLGASFGSDTNAFTGRTATTYQLDLPRADAGSYTQAMTVLGEMMRSARIEQPLLDTERNVVLAEGAVRLTPIARKQRDAANAVFLTGLKAARRDILGTPATLAAADAATLRTFYKRWYRPARAVVVVVGDADPALLEDGVRKAFEGWRGEGPPPAEPDYGAVAVPTLPVAVVADPQAGNSDVLAWVTPHEDGPVTIARVQRQTLQNIANAILNQRLSTAAQAGGALVNAGAGRGETRHIADQLSLGFVAKPSQSKAALDQVFAVVNDLRAHPPQQAEIDQQIAGLSRINNDRVIGRQTTPSAALANEFIGDVNDGDVTPDPSFYRDLFAAQRLAITPSAIARVLADSFAPEPRLLHQTSGTADLASLAAELAAARRVAAGQNGVIRAVSLDELKMPGLPGRILSQSMIADLGIQRVLFFNGVRLDFKQTPFEKAGIRITVRIGHGALNRPIGDPGLFWTAGALGAAGVGPYTRDELTRLTAGRQLGFGIGAGAEGVRIGAYTSRGDLADALRLMAAAVTQMRYADGPISRLRDQFAVSYQAIYGQPGSVLQAFASPYLHGDDQRFRAVPPLGEVGALTLPAFQRFWTEQLARGPIRIEVVGDLDPNALVVAVARSFGALPSREDVRPTAAQLAVTARRPDARPVVLRHRGDGDQAAVARVYPIPGAFQDLPNNRALGIAASIIQTRLTEEFREKDAGTYSPTAAISTSNDLPAYGLLLIGSQLRPARIGDFQTAIDRIVGDLGRSGPSADALARARATQLAALQRSRAENAYWMGVLDNDLDDPARIDAVRTALTGREAITAEQVKAATARYLRPGGGYTISALPEVTARP